MSAASNDEIIPPKERIQTDRSLSAERAKTDRSLNENREKAERQANEDVLKSRSIADKSLSQSRIDIDESNELEIAALEGLRLNERLEAEDRLQEERVAADKALDKERRHMDDVLKRERVQKSASEHKLLQLERSETDKDLTTERSQTDAIVHLAEKHLSQEKVAHAATRDALITRDEFLAIVSHDLRNPLGSVAMAVEFLKDHPYYQKVEDEEYNSYIDIIERSAGIALKLIGDLMDMEQFALGKLGLQIERHNIGNLVEQAIIIFKSHAFTKNISLEFARPAEAVFVRCDSNRIVQVLSNLIGNAIKFTPTGGRIFLALYAKDAGVIVSVNDNGPGISVDNSKTIFERFRQINNQDRRGLGLGLYICKMIIEAHQEQIWVKSELGKGSTFYFSLPA